MMLRHSFLILFVAVITSGISSGQRDANIGAFAGGAYYMGDINPNRHFYHSSISIGGLYRYNLNTRYALRLNAYYVHLSGSDFDFPDILHPDRPLSPARFNNTILDVCLQTEYNFLPYTPNQNKWDYTPYLAVGFAGALVAGSDAGTSNFISLPFSAGLKFTVSSRISAGLEWSFRKTFTDRLDGLENPSGKSSVLHNNDWYSMLGVFITFKFFKFATDCPAYKE